jgi:hypothetical protein
VTDSATRDVAEIIELGTPSSADFGVSERVPATSACPSAMGEVAIEAGDLIIGERDA